MEDQTVPLATNPSRRQKIRVIAPQVGVFSQIVSCVKRFSLQQMREPFSVALQILLPVAIIAALAGVSTLSPSEVQPSENFVNPPPGNSTNSSTTTFAGLLTNYVCYDDGSFYPASYTGPKLPLVDPNSSIPSILANDAFVKAILHPCSAFYNLSSNDIFKAAPATFPYVCSQQHAREFISPEGLCGFMNPLYPITNAFQDVTKVSAIPTVNEMLLTQWAARLVQPFKIPDFLRSPSIRFTLSISGYVYVTAADANQKAAANRLVGKLNASSGLFKNFAYQGIYDSVEQLTPRIRSARFEGTTWAVITVNRFGDSASPAAEQGFDVTLMLNRSAAGWTVRPRVNLYNGGTRDENYLQFLSGFLTLEKAIGEAFAALLLPSTSINSTSINTLLSPSGTPLAVAPMPFPEYRVARFLQSAGSTMPLLLSLCLLYSVSQLVKSIVEEKEKKLRAGMQAMGLHRIVSATSTLIVFMFQGLVTASVITVILSTTFLSLTDGSIIFVIFLLFCISSSCFGVLMSVFFGKARISGIIAPIVFLMCAIPSVAIPDGSAVGVVRLLNILSPSAFATGMKLLVQYEQVQGMGWNDTRNALDAVPMGEVIAMLVVDCILYFVLALYLDNIIPNEWGIRRPCCFCCSCCCPTSTSNSDRSNNHNAANSSSASGGGNGVSRRSVTYGSADAGGTAMSLEPLVSAFPNEGVVEAFAPTDVPVVSFFNVTKRYQVDGGKDKIAVNNFNLHLMEGQISVVLGHNGAGKTTAVNMLTGMVDISEGDIAVCGSSVHDNIDDTQQLIGICPQHNLLWDSLSCMHHLMFYARIKGLPDDLAEKRGLQLLKILELDNKKDQTASELSGGQKRRLSVAIAFVAGSPLVVCDESTAGTDVPSRRNIWKLFQRMCKSRSLGTDPETGERLFDEPDYLKTGCSILLITHFMDEADILGDRIAIMSAGQLHSYGSPEFLKSKLGRGYTLRFTTKQALSPNEVQHMLQEAIISGLEIVGATIGEAKGQEVMIRVPNSQVSKIPNALRTFSDPTSQSSQQFKVEAVAIEVSTMEDVFLRIADEENARHGALEEGKVNTPVAAIPVPDNSNSSTMHTNNQGHESLPQHIRDALDVCFQSRSTEKNGNDLNNNKNNHTNVAPGGSFGVQFLALAQKRFHFMRRDRRTLIFQLLVPVACVLLGMVLTGLKPPDSGLLDVESMYLPEEEEIPYTAFPCANSGDGIPQNVSAIKAIGVPVFSATTSAQLSRYLLDDARGHGTKERMTAWSCEDSQQLTTAIAYNIDACSPIANPSALTTSTCRKPSTVIFGNFSSGFSSSFGLSQWINAQIKRITTSNALPDMPVNFANKPLPFSNREQSNLDTISLLLGALFVALPFGFVPSTFVSFIVREREVRAKLIQRLSGVNFGAFWLSHAVFDFCTFFLTELLALLIFAILNHQEYIGPNAIGIVLVLFILNALATTGAGYCLSFVFDSHASAQTLTMLIGFMSGFVMVIFGFVLNSLDAGGVRFLFRLFPPYCFGEALVGIAIAHAQETSIGVPIDRWKLDNAGFTTAGWSLFFLGIESIVFYIAVFAVEFKSIWIPLLKAKKKAGEVAAENDVPPDADETWDVKEERQRTESTSTMPDGSPFPLQVKQLRKVYNRSLINMETEAQKKSNVTDYGSGRVVAVKNLSFTVQPGEIFGFLGVNGAGKTTTMEIITGACDASAGDAFIMGHSVTNESNITRQYIGYCPQFDALFDLLTCYEHLKMYCAIRGVDPAKQELVCSGLLEAVGLKQFRDVVAISLSGGNKRKLSVAVSLVGGPKLLLGDEMTAGIDSAARRLLWDVIIYVASKCAVVLTTHHLEEVEALAHRVGIMVPGKFACLGPLGRIKASIGGGVEIRIRANNAEELAEVERMLYAQAKQQAGLAPETTHDLLELVEKVEGRVTLRLPAAGAARAGITPANIFEWLLAMQLRKHFEFTVSNATIEQVFLALANQQEALENGMASPTAHLVSPTTPAAFEQQERSPRVNSAAVVVPSLSPPNYYSRNDYRSKSGEMHGAKMPPDDDFL